MGKRFRKMITKAARVIAVVTALLALFAFTDISMVSKPASKIGEALKGSAWGEYSYAAVVPAVSAKSAVCYCENTGETVFEKDPDKKLSPYSVTKLMTALVVVMETPLDKQVTVSRNAASQGESTIGLKEGEKATVEQLLCAALIQSGNDAAYALAEGTSDSVETFVKKMNKTAKNIGCKDTHFSNPAGLKSNENYTTASDFIKITKVAFENETIAKIAGTKRYTMKPTNMTGVREFTTNALSLTGDGNIYAGKNGFWDGDSTTAFEYRKNGLDLYVVILGDSTEGRKKDAKSIVDYAGEIIEGVVAVKGGEKVGAVRIKHGAKTKLSVYTKTDGYAYIPTEGSKSLITTETEIDDDVKAPVKKGEVVGKCNILVGGEKVNEVPIVIRESVGEGWFTSYLGISNDLAVVIAIVLACLLILLIILTVLRLHYRRKVRRERKRRAREIAARELQEEEERKKRGWDM